MRDPRYKIRAQERDRMAVLQRLASGPATTLALAVRLGMSTKVVAGHVRALAREGLIEKGRREAEHSITEAGCAALDIWLSPPRASLA